MPTLTPLLIPDWRERLADNARALGLTPRQTEIALLTIGGLTYPEIADALGLNVSSVKTTCTGQWIACIGMCGWTCTMHRLAVTRLSRSCWACVEGSNDAHTR